MSRITENLRMVGRFTVNWLLRPVWEGLMAYGEVWLPGIRHYHEGAEPLAGHDAAKPDRGPLSRAGNAMEDAAYWPTDTR